MSTSLRDATAIDVSADDRLLTVHLRDGRTISTPLSWFPRLERATTSERAQWRLIGGEGIHWLLIDEDISVAALLVED